MSSIKPLWKCSDCTYDNLFEQNICLMCRANRRAKRAKPSRPPFRQFDPNAQIVRSERTFKNVPADVQVDDVRADDVPADDISADVQVDDVRADDKDPRAYVVQVDELQGDEDRANATRFHQVDVQANVQANVVPQFDQTCFEHFGLSALVIATLVAIWSCTVPVNSNPILMIMRQMMVLLFDNLINAADLMEKATSLDHQIEKLFTAAGLVVNLGDGIRPGVSLFVFKHYAPWSCKDYNDPFGFSFCKIDRINPCIRAFDWIIPRSLHCEASGEWSDKLKEAVSKKISFVDMIPFIPKKKETHHKEAHDAAKVLGITWEQLMCISVLRFMLQSKYNLLSGGAKLRLLIASANVGHILFISPFFLVTIDSPFVYFCGAMAHGQCWSMRIPLMNVLVHPDEHLQFYTESAVRAYNDIVKVLGKSALAFKFGARMGHKLSAGDSACVISAILNGCRKGGKTTGAQVHNAFQAIKDALLAVKMGDESMAQIELLQKNTKSNNDDNDDSSRSNDDVDDSSDADDLSSGIEALLHGRVSEETLKRIENNHVYKIWKAYSARDLNIMTDEDQKLIDTNEAQLEVGRKTMAEIRRDVRDNGDDADPDNIAWVEAQNLRNAVPLEAGRETQRERSRLNLADKAFDILYLHGDEIYYGTDKRGRSTNIRWKATGKLVNLSDPRISRIGIPNTIHNWPEVKWFLEEIYKEIMNPSVQDVDEEKSES